MTWALHFWAERSKRCSVGGKPARRERKKKGGRRKRKKARKGAGRWEPTATGVNNKFFRAPRQNGFIFCAPPAAVQQILHLGKRGKSVCVSQNAIYDDLHASCILHGTALNLVLGVPSLWIPPIIGTPFFHHPIPSHANPVPFRHFCFPRTTDHHNETGPNPGPSSHTIAFRATARRHHQSLSPSTIAVALALAIVNSFVADHRAKSKGFVRLGLDIWITCGVADRDRACV